MTYAPTMLANADASPLQIANFIVTGIVALAMFVLNNRQRRMEKLESRVEENTAQAVNQSLQGLETKIAAPIAALQAEAKRVDRRLEIGEEEFAKLRGDDTELKLEVIGRLERLSDKIDGKYASQSELKRLEERVTRIETWREQHGGKGRQA